MKRGEIKWYKFQSSHSPDKKSPVLLLTRDSVISYLGEVTIAPITSIIRDIPSEVFLSKDDGLPKDCVVNCDHIQTVSKGKIGPLIATLPDNKNKNLKEAINFALAL